MFDGAQLLVILAWLFPLICGEICYVAFLGMTLFGLKRLRKRTVKESLVAPKIEPGAAQTLSIILAARNEADLIARTLEYLLAQDYPPNRFDIIVVDDRSEDDTAAIVESFSRRDPRIKLIRQTDIQSGVSPKKQALEAGIAASSAEIVATTDADCTHRPDWLSTLVARFTPETDMVAGQARFELPSNTPLWQRLQALDFQSQNVAAAGLIAAGSPFNCIGASLAFRRAAFDAVGGWSGIKHLISGDDEQLMAKLHRAGRKIVAATGAGSVVLTRPPASIKELWHQRIRWGSKGLHYRFAQKFFLTGVFVFLLELTLMPLALFALILSGGDLVGHGFRIWAGAAAAKLLIDLGTLHRGQQLFNDKVNVAEFLLAEIVHPAAIVAFALGGTLGKFEWKGRKY